MEKYFPLPSGSGSEESPASKRVRSLEDETLPEVFKMKADLLAKINILGEKFPKTTLDQMIHQLGGPENVAEVYILVLHLITKLQ